MKPIRTRVVHSQSKDAWNVVGDTPGCKYKIARVPYVVVEGEDVITTRNKAEAMIHAQFISYCFGIADKTGFYNSLTD